MEFDPNFKYAEVQECHMVATWNSDFQASEMSEDF